MGDVVEPEIIGIHHRPGVHRIGDDGRCIATQVIVDQITIPDVRQTINRLQSLASLRKSVLIIFFFEQ